MEIAEKTVPDVVITDIKMPFMDGLKLAEQLSTRYPTVKIIVLTGFDEFEYAQKAIKLSIFDYVLKPVSSKELIDILIKLKHQLDKEIAEKEDISVLIKNYNESLPIIKEKFMNSLIINNESEDEILKKSANYNIDLKGRGYIVSVISADSKSYDSSINKESGAISTWEKGELLKCAILDISEQVVNKYKLGIIFFHDEKFVIISVSKEQSKDEALKKTITILEEIKQTLEKYLKITVTIGVGTYADNVTCIKNSYKVALSALDYRLVLGSSRIILIEDIEPHTENKIIFDEYKERELITSIKAGTEDEINNVLDKLFNYISSSKSSIKDSQVYLMEMLITVLKAAKESNADMENVFGGNMNLFMTLDNMKDIDEIKKWMKEICIKTMKYIIKDRQDTSKAMVRKAKDYVNNSYYESDITINKICNYLHISPTYFSFIFKKETKTTFINYLTDIRMESAKELLRTTSMKTFEIAEKIGYSEPNYFSYCFKKKFDMSPSEYRNSAKK
jgi:two-component system response regulator YesN